MADDEPREEIENNDVDHKTREEIENNDVDHSNVDVSESGVENTDVENADVTDDLDVTDKEKSELPDEKLERKRIFDGDRFEFSGRCDICKAGIMADKDHIEFLLERACAPTRSFFYRTALSKHWSEYQGLMVNMQPFCKECKKHFWGLHDLTRHVHNMATHGVEDCRVLEENEASESVEKQQKSEEAPKSEQPSTAEDEKKTAATPGKRKMKKNINRAKRGNQVRREAIEAELQRRLKRAEEISAFLPEEDLPSVEQREENKRTHAVLLEKLKKIIQMGCTKPPEMELMNELSDVVCGQSPRWFEASYRLGKYENLGHYVANSIIQDLSSGKANVASLEARWRLSTMDMDEDAYLEITGKLNEQTQLSAADRERTYRRIAETGDLWKDDDCSPSGDAFTCLVCDRKGRSLRIHLDEALWLTNSSSSAEKNKDDLPDCPISTEASLSEMRNNAVMAHVYHYLGEENTRRLIEELSLKSKRVLRCPACKFHYRALRCCIPELFTHIQTHGFMKVDGEFKDAHRTVALKISAVIAEARGGFRSTRAIVDELIDYLSCDEGGLHFKRRGAVTAAVLRANPRVMSKIRQSVARKMNDDAKKATPQKTPVANQKKPGRGNNQQQPSRDHLRGVAQSKQPPMKNKGQKGRRGGFRGSLMGTHLPTNIRSAPSQRNGSMIGSRSHMDPMGGSVQVGVYCELCSMEFYGFSFNEANRQLHAHLMDALFRSRREPGKAKMAAQHLTCFSNNLVYNTVSFCPACQMTLCSLDTVFHHITQLASSNELTAVHHMNIANDLVSQFIECMNGTMNLSELSIFVQRRFLR